MYLAGSGLVTNVNLTFADGASAFGSSTLVSGTYRPSASNFPYDFGQNPLYGLNTISTLSGFVGSPTTGTWTLSEWYGGFAGSDGNISNGWTVTFTILQSAPTVTTLAASNVTASSAKLERSRHSQRSHHDGIHPVRSDHQ